MDITHGLLPGQVLQRNDKNRGYTIITGTCESVGSVELCVQKDGKTLRKHDWQPVGDAMDSCFFAELSNLKTGGPYTVKLRVRRGGITQEKLSVKEIFVGDVWFLAGQSNMEGVGNLKNAPKSHEKVRAFYMRDEWEIAEKKLHFLGEAVDSVHNGYGDGSNRPPQEKLDKIRSNQIKGVGPGHAFGLDMFKRTKVPQGLVACAHGGTSMAQWSSELRKEGGASLYGAMMRRFETLGQPIAGILWYQGESDASAEAAKVYTQKMIELVAATRADMENPELPWFVVQLGCHACPTDGDVWNSIQEQQRLLPEVIESLDVAPAIDLDLDDGIHISGKGQTILGKRLARLADRMVNKNKKAKPGIVLTSIDVVRTPDCNVDSGCTAVKLTYGNVVGGLKAKGRPTGFVLLDEAGEPVGGFYRTTVHGNTVLLHSNFPKFRLGMFSVSYGLGRCPYCNITDAENMSIPVIQSIPLNPDQPAVADNWQTTFLKDELALARVGYAKAHGAKGWRKAPARGGIGVLPKPADSNRIGIYAMRTTLIAKEELDALLTFGANAPFKIWLNGKSLLNDFKATMPLKPEQYHAELTLNKGKNELLVALAVPGPGAHLGISAVVGSPDGKAEPRISS